jgi:hypothetical protein
MSKIGFLLAVPAVVLAGACAQVDATPAAAPVPAGCDPTANPLTWSSTRTTPILVEAARYGAAELAAGTTGTLLLNQPFTPSITNVAAPASWLIDLGNSLARETGKPVHTDAPSAEGQSFGMVSGPEQTPVVLYTGVDQVSADFEVQCNPTVRGTLHAWSQTVAGGVACEYQPDVQLDTFGRLALQLCPPDLLTPPPSDPVEGEQLPDGISLN